MKENDWYNLGYKEEKISDIFNSVRNFDGLNFFTKLVDKIAKFREDLNPYSQMEDSEGFYPEDFDFANAKKMDPKVKKQTIEEIKNGFKTLKDMVENSVMAAILASRK